MNLGVEPMSTCPIRSRSYVAAFGYLGGGREFTALLLEH